MNAARRQVIDAGLGQFGVGADRSGAFGFPLRQRRRIEHDEVKLALRLTREPLEDIGLYRLMTATRDGRIVGIEGEIALGGIQRVPADVEVGDGLRPAARGKKREAAGEAEGIENCSPAGE